MTTDNRIGLAGDWHGSFQWTRYALHTFGQAGVKTVFHLGDFSLGWPGKWPDLINIAESICKYYDMKLFITPGNHENWEWINTRQFTMHGLHSMTDHTFILDRVFTCTMPYHDADGKEIGRRKILSLSGAPSIDFDMRTRGIDWWPEELMSEDDAEEVAQIPDVDIMLCHDAPDGSTDAVQKIIDSPWEMSIFSRKGLEYAREGRKLMNLAVWGQRSAFDDKPTLPGARPKVFAHGHFHAPDSRQDDDTLWLSMGCNSQRDNLATLDLETLQPKFLPIIDSYARIEELEKLKKRGDR